MINAIRIGINQDAHYERLHGYNFWLSFIF